MKPTTQETFTAQDHIFMKMARQLAKKSLAFAEVPVGALIVSPLGTIIGRGYNKVEKDQTQLAHAEMQALKQAARAIGGWRLEDCTLYVTLEPCMMCLGATLLSRVKTIIYGAPSHLFGIEKLMADLPPVYRAHTLIRQGLQQNECGDMLSHFFAKIRANQETIREQKNCVSEQNTRSSS